MHFALTSDQELARNALRELLAEHCTATHLRRVFEAEAPTRAPGLWTKLHELGVIGALAPEAVGGLGLNAIDLTVLLEETGRAAVPELLVETAAVAVPLLAALPEDPRAAHALQHVLSGELSVAVALATRARASAVASFTRDGSLNMSAAASADNLRSAQPGDCALGHTTAPTDVAEHQRGEEHALHTGPSAQPTTSAGIALALVPGAALSGLILCEHNAELHALESQRLQLTPVETVDRARRVYQLDLHASTSAATCLARGALAQQLLAAARDHAALGTAAQLVGLGDRMLELTINHVKTRKQFGQAIGAFQAVKHQLVDARLALEFATPLVYRAAHSVAHADPERSLHVSMAKAFASEAALLAARKALQLHGAIGYSWEYELQLYMKRAWALAAAHGDALEHRTRIADAMLTAPIVQGERYA